MSLTSNLIIFNPESPAHISALFFGGTFKIIIKEPLKAPNGEVMRFKKGAQKEGEIRYRNTTKVVKVKGLSLRPLDEWKTLKKGVYSVQEKTLVYIKKNAKGIAQELATELLKIRGLSKQLTTYYIGIEEYLETDNIVHPQFQLVATDTSRSSCKDPNVQNQPDSESSKIRAHFTSRYANGVLVACDYSQIEVKVQAELSGDENLIALLETGYDEHCSKLALKENIPYEVVYEKCKIKEEKEWINKRKNIKSFTFARQYRMAPWGLAKTTGMSEKEVKTLIQKERRAFPKVEAFNEALRRRVEATGQYKSPLGRIYKFTRKPYKDHEYNRFNQYRYPEIVNYIIQGTATSDISVIMAGKFWRKHAIHNRDKYLMINFVHDEIVFDCKKEHLDTLKNHAKILDTWKEIAYNKFNIKWKTDIKTNFATGSSWFDCK